MKVLVKCDQETKPPLVPHHLGGTQGVVSKVPLALFLEMGLGWYSKYPEVILTQNS